MSGAKMMFEVRHRRFNLVLETISNYTSDLTSYPQHGTNETSFEPNLLKFVASMCEKKSRTFDILMTCFLT
ncbi:MAG: hypothetical protein D9C04_03670 [Nitrosopumilus sp. B06]|nr:MAG: hypothetical protein D9C04_03670 [Nitrosopumilus sp. B06]